MNASRPSRLGRFLLAFVLAASCTAAHAFDLFTARPVGFSDPGGPSFAISAAIPVAVDATALGGASTGTTVTLTAPDGRTFDYVLERRIDHDATSFTWIGVLAGHSNDFRMILTYSPAAVFGQFVTPDGSFRVDTSTAGTWLIDRARSNLQVFAPAGDDAIPPPPSRRPKAATDAPRAKAGPSAFAVIDVLVLYSPGLVTRLGSVQAVNTRVNYLVAVANQSYADSNIPAALRLLQATRIDGVADNTNNDVELDNITDGVGVYAGVAALRDATGADMVTLLRPFNRIAQVSCGVAWIGGYQYSDISLDADYGYSVVSDGTDGGYFCLDHTYVHELGHNMGSMHDRVTMGGSTAKGAYPYSFGYGVNNSFFTVMAYASSYGGWTAQREVGKFSSPTLTCMGVPCGIPASNTTQSADNAQSIYNTRDGVASWRQPVAITASPTAGAQERSLAVAGGFPVTDWFDLAPRAMRSYELQVLNVTATSALTAADSVARYDGRGITMLQAAACLDPGCTTRTMRWIAGTDSEERVRVTNGSLAANAAYTTQLRETSLYCPRWNQSGSQSSTMILQRSQPDLAATCTVNAYFLDGSGAQVGGQVITLANNKIAVQPLAGIAGLDGRSGSVVLAHTCGLGGLKGTIAALEPATGFSFNTPCQERAR